ncbi:MAG TPA: hypothetical protein VJZ71_17100 [Phycisphaerae bacterium]|nr:hypothetical protein [Phycisphaerae bacterium]
MRRTVCDEARAGGASLWNSPSIAVEIHPPETVSNLDARIIAHRLFPLRKWYYASPLWYYHAPAREHCLRTDSHFYELVDPVLRELCKTLLDAGLMTTPSCQGHFYPRARFERVWDELVRESGAICNGGLVVHDCESDRSYHFASDSYRLPWRDFETFYYEADRHQNEGYLGIMFPPALADMARRLEAAFLPDVPARIEQDVELTRLLGQPLVGVYVSPASPDERDRAWRKVTRCVQEVLQQEGRL